MHLALVALLASCGGKENVEGDGTGDDTAADTAGDTTDVLADTADDTAPDTADDTAPDTADDTAGETAADTGTDVADEDAGGTGGIVGDPCEDMDDCLGVPSFPTCITFIAGGPAGGIEFPNGYCSGDCVNHDDCGTGALCADSMGGMRMCMQTCTSDSDCREAEGYECRARHEDPQTYCLPPRPSFDGWTDAIPDVFPDMPGDIPMD